MMLSNQLILCHPLLLLPSIFPSIRVFSNELALCIRCQSIGVSASASVLPKNIQGWFPLGLTDLIFLLSKGLSRIFSSTTVQKHQFFSTHPSLWSSSHICLWLLEKIIALTIWTFVGKAMSLLFNTLARCLPNPDPEFRSQEVRRWVLRSLFSLLLIPQQPWRIGRMVA